MKQWVVDSFTDNSYVGQVDGGCIGCGLCIQPLQRKKEGEEQTHRCISNRALIVSVSRSVSNVSTT